jgi:hypothetical protein
MTNYNNYRDLDMSDVLRDADDQFDAFLHSIWGEDEVELARLRYLYGEEARQGTSRYSLAVVATIDGARAERLHDDIVDRMIDR